MESLPQTNPVNQDVLKALRQTGFPDVEAKASAMSLATNVGGNIQKRLNKLDEAWNKIQAIPASERTSLMTKTLCQAMLFLINMSILHTCVFRVTPKS